MLDIVVYFIAGWQIGSWITHGLDWLDRKYCR